MPRRAGGGGTATGAEGAKIESDWGYAVIGGYSVFGVFEARDEGLEGDVGERSDAEVGVGEVVVGG